MADPTVIVDIYLRLAPDLLDIFPRLQNAKFDSLKTTVMQ
jgi:hypothetical protein